MGPSKGKVWPRDHNFVSEVINQQASFLSLEVTSGHICVNWGALVISTAQTRQEKGLDGASSELQTAQPRPKPRPERLSSTSKGLRAVKRHQKSKQTTDLKVKII